MKRKEDIFSNFGWYVQWREKSNSRERKSNFSLDFPASGSSVRVGLRSKVVLRCKGYAWTQIL